MTGIQPAPRRVLAAPGDEPSGGLDAFRREHLRIHYLDSAKAVRAAAREVDRIAPSLVAVDFETASNTGHWGSLNGSLRLIQLGLDEPERGIEPRQLLIDCHHVDPRPLTRILADAAVETYLHYVDFELEWSLIHLGEPIRNIYDTYIAWLTIQKKLKALPPEEAQALLPGWEKHNNKLATLTDRYMGIPLVKDDQSSDWGRPRLDTHQILYAATDTAVLPPLAAITKRIAEQVGVADDVHGLLRWVTGKVIDRAYERRAEANDDYQRVRTVLTLASTPAELRGAWTEARAATLCAANQQRAKDLYETRLGELRAAQASAKLS